MRQLRLILVAVLVIATTAQRFRGMLLGLTIIAVNELVHQLLQLRGPSGRRRRPTLAAVDAATRVAAVAGVAAPEGVDPQGGLHLVRTHRR